MGLQSKLLLSSLKWCIVCYRVQGLKCSTKRRHLYILFILRILYLLLVLRELCPIKHELGISLMCLTYKVLVHYVGHMTLSRFEKKLESKVVKVHLLE